MSWQTKYCRLSFPFSGRLDMATLLGLIRFFRGFDPVFGQRHITRLVQEKYQCILIQIYVHSGLEQWCYIQCWLPEVSTPKKHWPSQYTCGHGCNTKSTRSMVGNWDWIGFLKAFGPCLPSGLMSFGFNAALLQGLLIGVLHKVLEHLGAVFVIPQHQPP